MTGIVASPRIMWLSWVSRTLIIRGAGWAPLGTGLILTLPWGTQKGALDGLACVCGGAPVGSASLTELLLCQRWVLLKAGTVTAGTALQPTGRPWAGQCLVKARPPMLHNGVQKVATSWTDSALDIALAGQCHCLWTAAELFNL